MSANATLAPSDVAVAIHQFYASTPAPASLASVESRLAEFLTSVGSATRRVVCITSGGTIVPLEQNTVRFIDNFSTGTRGAALAEHFLRRSDEYHVIFLHRTGSALPFLRRLPTVLAAASTTNHAAATTPINSPALLNAIRVQRQANDGGEATGTLEIPTNSSTAAAFSEYEAAAHRLLLVDFLTIGDYLHLLRSVCAALRPLGRRAALLLAAAVSDYYIPFSEMSVHKLDSRAGSGLDLRLAATPKVLHALRHTLPSPDSFLPQISADTAASSAPSSDPSEAWLPSAFLCSFKLETDATLLIRKSRDAIRAYGVNVVLANELHTRYDRVHFVRASDIPSRDGSPSDIELILRQQPQPATASPPVAAIDPFDLEIEVQLQERLVSMHTAWLQASGPTAQ